MTYKPSTIVRVPFPFVDSRASKNRPALVISTEEYNSTHSHSVMAMITMVTVTTAVAAGCCVVLPPAIAGSAAARPTHAGTLSLA